MKTLIKLFTCFIFCIEFIYSIGGQTDNVIKTKLCERYSLNNDKWEKIANLNFAKSKSLTTTFQSYIYSFYGTNSFGKTIDSIEKYNYEENVWEIICPANKLPGFEVTCGAATQINNEQIIIFGGFRDSDHFKNQISFNRKIYIFNTINNSFIVSNNEIPIDFINSCNSQPIITNNNIYCFGHFPQTVSPNLVRCLDNDYLLKISNQKSEIYSVVDTKISIKNKQSQEIF